MAGENLLVVDDSPTILKVVESALTRAGFQVDVALDAATGMELARARRPAVILIDSLIPGDGIGPGASSGTGPLGDPGRGAGDHATGGSRLCGALAADAFLSDTPVVLMTAKGEDLEARYARSSNVIDYITKPFSPDAVLAVITHVIEKTGLKNQATAVDRRTPVPHTPEGPSVVAQALSKSRDPDPAGALARFRIALVQQLERYRRETGSWELADLTRGALPDPTLAGLLADAGFDATQGDTIGPDLGGRLGATSLSEVLILLGQQGQTGTLRVLNELARVEIFFRKGLIDFAAAIGVAEEFLLGRFAIEAGYITPESLAQVLDARARMTEKPPLFGRDLVTRELITPDQLRSAMRRQTAELTYEALRWSRGTFQFRHSDDLPEPAEEAALEIVVDTLLLEGFRRVDEWRLIERDIQNFDIVFLRADDRIAELPRGTLTRDEIAVLDALTGKNSVRDLVRSLRMGSFDVSKVLYRLLRTKLIRRRIKPVAA